MPTSLVSQNGQDQKEMLSSDSDWLRQSLRNAELAHPALARLRHKLDVEDCNLIEETEYSRTIYSRSCFPAGTEILLADRTTRVIEQISVGDHVMSFDGSKPVSVRVESLESPLRDHHCVLSFADGSVVRLTQEHPLYTRNGWRSLSPESTVEENAKLLVGKLEIGDQILTVHGEYRTLVGISFRPGEIQTYNIKNRHDNFYVNGFLAHTKAQMSLCGQCAERFADFACITSSALDCHFQETVPLVGIAELVPSALLRSS